MLYWVHIDWAGFELTTSVVIGTKYMNDHSITVSYGQDISKPYHVWEIVSYGQDISKPYYVWEIVSYGQDISKPYYGDYKLCFYRIMFIYTWYSWKIAALALNKFKCHSAISLKHQYSSHDMAY
jgi:hypothetical protein